MGVEQKLQNARILEQLRLIGVTGDQAQVAVARLSEIMQTVSLEKLDTDYLMFGRTFVIQEMP